MHFLPFVLTGIFGMRCIVMHSIVRVSSCILSIITDEGFRYTKLALDTDRMVLPYVFGNNQFFCCTRGCLYTIGAFPTYGNQMGNGTEKFCITKDGVHISQIHRKLFIIHFLFIYLNL